MTQNTTISSGRYDFFGLLQKFFSDATNADTHAHTLLGLTPVTGVTLALRCTNKAPESERDEIVIRSAHRPPCREAG